MLGFFTDIDPKLTFRVRESNFACLFAGGRGKYILKVLSCCVFIETMCLFTFKLLEFYVSVFRLLEKVAQFSFTEDTTQQVV